VQARIRVTAAPGLDWRSAPVAPRTRPVRAFAADAERLARFDREAKTLASLNHPHIVAIYGFEKSSGLHALVMELVDGEDLAQRLARGAIPMEHSDVSDSWEREGDSQAYFDTFGQQGYALGIDVAVYVMTH
jgi:hypothetical protein